MRLSEHLTLEEMIKSQTAARRGIDNDPRGRPDGDQIILNLQDVALNIFEPARRHFGIPTSPSSGYRSPKLNRAIGGARSSQHVKGQAIDFEFPGVPNVELARWLRSNVDFDQLILEFHKPSVANSGWVHASYDALGNRGEVLTKIAGEKFYQKGLVI